MSASLAPDLYHDQPHAMTNRASVSALGSRAHAHAHALTLAALIRLNGRTRAYAYP
jgi:hypothetical protein